MRVLITRYASAATKLAAILESEGFETQLEPLLEIKFNLQPVSLEGVQAMIVTSANGATALARSTEDRHQTVFAVGGATATALEEEGFNNILSAGGNVTALKKLVSQTLSPDAGTLVHVSGEHIAGDLGRELTDDKFSVRRKILYRAEIASVMSDATTAAFGGHKIDVVLFFSHRTATTFASLVIEAGLENDLTSISAICLSEAVANPIKSLSWQKIEISEKPDQQALLQTLFALRNE